MNYFHLWMASTMFVLQVYGCNASLFSSYIEYKKHVNKLMNQYFAHLLKTDGI